MTHQPCSKHWSKWLKPHLVFDRQSGIQKLGNLSKVTHLVHRRTQIQTWGYRVYAFSTWNKPAKRTSQMADCMAGVGRAGTLSWYSLSRKPVSQTKPNFHRWGWEAVGEILVYGGRIWAPAEGGPWVYLWAWTAHQMCVRSGASSVWSRLCLVLIGQRTSSHCIHQ